MGSNGTWRAQWFQLYMGWQQCDDTFSQKKIPFCFNHLRDPAAESRSQKDWEFKIF
jgi:hypothetical protein